jgi:hypothetical protein
VEIERDIKLTPTQDGVELDSKALFRIDPKITNDSLMVYVHRLVHSHSGGVEGH